MTLATCDYCGTECDSRLIKEVGQSWPGGACYACRGAHCEVEAMHEQDRIDAARWRALRPFLFIHEEFGAVWLDIKHLPLTEWGSPDDSVDKLVQLVQEQKP